MTTYETIMCIVGQVTFYMSVVIIVLGLSLGKSNIIETITTMKNPTDKTDRELLEDLTTSNTKIVMLLMFQVMLICSAMLIFAVVTGIMLKRLP